MWSPPLVPKGAWSLAMIIFFWPLNFWTLLRCAWQGDAKRRGMDSMSGKSRGTSGEVREAWGMLLSRPHSAETNSKGHRKGKMRSQNTQLEGRVWKEVA